MEKILKNKLFINIIFFALAFLGILLLISKIDNEKIEIPLVEKINSTIYLNIKSEKEILLFENGKEIFPEEKNGNPYLIYQIKNKAIKNLALKGNPEKIIVINGTKLAYFKEENIKKFEKDENGNFIFPNTIKYSKNSSYITDKGSIKKFGTQFLSVFYNFNFYITGFLMLVLAGFIYCKNKSKINLRFNLFKNHAIWLIAALGLIFRIQDIGSSPFWWDELYASTMGGNPDFPIISIFLDPGNPPLFFFLAKIHLKVFNCCLSGLEATAKILPLIFSFLTIFIVYFFVKENIDKKTAIIASLLFSLNVYSIYTATEFRAYSLCIFLSAAVSLFLFRIIKENKKKDFIIYAILGALLSNTHWFGVFILIGNFIWGLFFIRKKLWFFYSNLFAAIVFLPYFIGDILINKAFSADLGYMQAPSLFDIFDIFSKLFFGKICAVSVIILSIIIFCKRKELNKTFIQFYFYSVYSILFLLAFLFIFSYAIKPIIRPYYFICIIYFIPIILALFCSIDIKNKILKFTIVFLLFASYFSGHDYVKRDGAKLINFDLLFKYSYLENEKNTGILLSGLDYFAKFYGNYLNENESVIEVPNDATDLKLIEIVQKLPNDTVLYLRPNNIYEAVSLIEGKYDYEYIKGQNDIYILKIKR